MGSWTRDQSDSIAFLKLNRPPVNALDKDALDELACLLRQIDSDSGVRVLVVTGAIDNLFCTGGDLKYWRKETNAIAVSSAGRDVFALLAQMEIPTIAAINGHVIGDGLALAMACDLRVASDRATFRLPETAYGFIPGWGTVRELVGLIGRTHAAELMLTGRPLDAAGAHRIGLVGDVVPPDRLQPIVLERSLALSSFSGTALAAMKCALRGGDEVACFERVWGSSDWHEGIDALLEKRAPRFERQ